MTLDSAYRKTRKTHSRGTRVLQPLATDVLEGTLYFVTDEGVIERSNGTIWESFSGSGGGSSTSQLGVMLSPLSIEAEEESNFYFPPARGLEITKGFWTPSDGSGAGLTFTSVLGEWRRIGEIVFVSWVLRYPITANTAISRINGLPFPVGAIDAAFAAGFASNPQPMYLYAGTGTSYISPITQGGGISITNNNMSFSWVDASGFYFVT